MRTAQQLVSTGQIGDVRHINCVFAAPLEWLFDGPKQALVETTGSMKGNGFELGQFSHYFGSSW